jgi:hypothetical protein
LAQAAGIAYGTHEPASWICFVEAKCFSDCSPAVSYDPLRNQLAQVIENALCFQHEGEFPERVFFTLLTPRFFKEHPNSRLYGYKMREYADPEKLLADIELSRILVRNDAGYLYPQNLRERLKVLQLNWGCYEDMIEGEVRVRFM